MNDISIVFGGFYETWHGQRLEDAAYDTDDMGDIIDRDVSPEEWSEMRDIYCREYVKFLNEELETNIEFSSVYLAPNYSGPDLILAKCSDEEIEKIIDRANTRYYVEVSELVVDICTGRDGYAPFYTVPELIKDRPRLLSAALEVLINKELDDEWEYYFDRNSIYDNLRI